MLQPLSVFVLASGKKLAISPAAIEFIEDLKPEVKKAHKGASSGIFYNTGTGLQSALLSMPFPRVLKMAQTGTPRHWLELKRSRSNDRTAVPADTVRGIVDLEGGHDSRANTQVMHQLGEQQFSLFVMQTFDEIHAMVQAAEQVSRQVREGMRPAPMPVEEAEEETDGGGKTKKRGGSASDAGKPRRVRSRGGAAPA